MPQSFSGTFVCEEICNSFFLLHLKNFYILQNKICEAVDSVMFCFFLFCLFFFSLLYCSSIGWLEKHNKSSLVSQTSFKMQPSPFPSSFVQVSNLTSSAYCPSHSLSSVSISSLKKYLNFNDKQINRFLHVSSGSLHLKLSL